MGKKHAFHPDNDKEFQTQESQPARNRMLYALLAICTMSAGFLSRRFLGDNAFIKLYVGDALWALMVFFGLAFIFQKQATRTIALAALLFSFGIEFSQLYHAPWIDKIRNLPLGGLILGFSFVWSDLICYSLGIGFGVLVEIYIIEPFYRLRNIPDSL